MNSYKFKDILFGLRCEYLMIEKELRELNKYISFNSDKIDDIKFYLSYSSLKGKVCMMYRLIMRKNILEKIFNSIFVNKNKDNSNLLDLSGNDNNMFGDDILINLIDGFNVDVLNILDSEFVSNIVGKYSSLDNNGSCSQLYTGPSYMSVSRNNGRMCDAIIYVPDKIDYLKVFSWDKNISSKLIDDILNIEFSSCCFSQYHQRMIEKEIVRNREVCVVGDLSVSDFEEFYIVEEPNRLVLSKVKK